MAKRHVTLTVDDYVIDTLKGWGINISAEVNEYLAQLVRRGPDITPVDKQNDLEKGLAGAVKEAREQEHLIRLQAKLEPFVNYYKMKMLDPKSKMAADPAWREQWLEHTARQVGMTVKELVGWIKGARPVPVEAKGRERRGRKK